MSMDLPGPVNGIVWSFFLLLVSVHLSLSSYKKFYAYSEIRFGVKMSRLFIGA